MEGTEQEVERLEWELQDKWLELSVLLFKEDEEERVAMVVKLEDECAFEHGLSSPLVAKLALDDDDWDTVDDNDWNKSDEWLFLVFWSAKPDDSLAWSIRFKSLDCSRERSAGVEHGVGMPLAKTVLECCCWSAFVVSLLALWMTDGAEMVIPLADDRELRDWGNAWCTV